MNRTHLLVSLALLAGCSTSPSDPGPSRQVAGQLSTRSMLTLDNPAIVVTRADGKHEVVHVSRTGEFTLRLRTDTEVRLGIATTTRAGTLRETSTIAWPNRSTRVDPGLPIDLGVVHKRGEDASACHREERSGGDEPGGERCTVHSTPRADLPYDAKLPLGASYRLSNSFFEKGALPAKILSVTMEGGSWRLAELEADTVFTVTAADCQHAGNRSTGRDRIDVSWQNLDGSTASDHLDLRYCDGDQAPPAAPLVALGAAPTPILCDAVELCDASNQAEHECDHRDFEGVQAGGTVPGADACPGGIEETPGNGSGSLDGGSGIGEVPGGSGGSADAGTLPPSSTGGPGAAGSPCTVNADCALGLGCFQSTCAVPIN